MSGELLTETEKLARLLRRIVLGALALLLAAALFVVGRIGVAFAWDLATTDTEERVAACVEEVGGGDIEGVAQWTIERLCREGDVDGARDRVADEREQEAKDDSCRANYESYGKDIYPEYDYELYDLYVCS